MYAMNFEQARFNMVEQQIRPWEVLDAKVLELLHEIPREKFVHDDHQKFAYSDVEIPLNNNQRMLFPKIAGHIAQALDLKDSDRVLEVGTGSGYLCCLLSRLSNHVYSVDIHPDLLKTAGRRLNEIGVSNVTLEEGNAVNGWDEHAPYDAIALTGAVHTVSDNLLRNLAIGGRLFVVQGESPAMKACLITRVDENNWQTDELFETDLPYLLNGEKPSEFSF